MKHVTWLIISLALACTTDIDQDRNQGDLGRYGSLIGSWFFIINENDTSLYNEVIIFEDWIHIISGDPLEIMEIEAEVSAEGLFYFDAKGKKVSMAAQIDQHGKWQLTLHDSKTISLNSLTDLLGVAKFKDKYDQNALSENYIFRNMIFQEGQSWEMEEEIIPILQRDSTSNGGDTSK